MLVTSLRECQTEVCAQLGLGGGGGVEWCPREEEWKSLELFPIDLGGALGVARWMVSWAYKLNGYITDHVAFLIDVE